LINSDNNLLIANDKLIATNEKFAAVNKELAGVNKELAQVNGQIKQYHEKQNEFINIISHELNTPIQAIIGYIELFFEQS
jgi:signal transduction histidine kinase